MLADHILVYTHTHASSSKHRPPREKGMRRRQLSHTYMDTDPHLSWFSRPHTITFLTLVLVALVYTAFTRSEAHTTSENVKFGLGAVVAVFLFYCMVQLKDGVFIRPHPVIWRLINGITILYFLFNVFLLFQTVDDARELLSYYDPELNTPLPERNYAEDCTFYTPDDPESNFANLVNTVHDEFVLAHFIGWWAKAFVFRDWFLATFCSLLFELMEMTFKHWLPNFSECWWDSVILDILVCNLGGIFMGMMTIKYFRMKKYDWRGREYKKDDDDHDDVDEEKSTRASKMVAAARRRIEDARPTIDPFKWNMMTNWKHFYCVTLLAVTCELIELNCFFLKHILWIPSSHQICVARLLIMELACLPAAREFYQFATDPTCKRLGAGAWLLYATVGLELLVIAKFSDGMFAAPIPSLVVWSWTIALSLFFGVSLSYFVWRNYKKKDVEKEEQRTIYIY
eukprot:TRINITY_DN3191_c0_g1_i2.p1 TRINITY_DN3191_c0_g1~~TRINITY_DN3191_c0_g1_i2.p1  ORF type:complete len:455 (+),score=91.50 TRINITY_DN3191_c0_g1_i2:253-1617(+)